ncbi:VG15 protein [Alloscardovia macacae]|uniref:tRNA nuclease CdiA C-terminal domain-containing protein n=1 Tax=Alloscardovia macacae TaxID=1160091 RepID=A0A261F200_9BIFI|nr:hypothetical protein [Alloscardovia macacae]OZG53095.1 hypothetical protein ALMA_1397 [Alloscardovia macacae]
MTVRRNQTKHATPEHANIQADEPDNILTLNIPAKDFRAKQDEAYAEYQQKMNNLLNDASGIVSGIVSNNELEQFRPAMEELVAKQKKITEDYYFKIRTMSAEDGGVTLPKYVKVPDTDANRAMWKTVGGFAHTDYNGLRYRDVITGNNAAGKTMDDVWDLGYRKFPLDPNTMDYGPWEDLAHELLYNADRLHMTRLTETDPSQPRYARVPHGPACEFCIMLAGRGFVYHTSESAGGEFHTYHAHDHCSVIPSWNKQNLTHYDPEGMKERYEQCTTTVQYLTTESLYEQYVETELEKQKDLKKENQKWKTYSQWKRDIILAEMRTRSRDWLYDGKAIPVSYTSEEVQKNVHPAELRTATRLGELGVVPIFKQDWEVIGDTPKGLADLISGIELKTLENAHGKNTIDGHLKNVSKKRDARICVIDNSKNQENMTDDALTNIIRRSQRFKRGKIYILNKDKQMIRIR